MPLSHVLLFATPWTDCPWDSPGQNTGVGSLFLLPGISPTQGSNPGIEPRSPALQIDSLPTELSGKPFEQETQAEKETGM